MAEGEKTFTQEEVDDLISKRLAREAKKYPTEEEMTAFRSWKDSQQTEKDKYDKMEKDLGTANDSLKTANDELTQHKRENFLLKKGISADDVEYYAFKIGKLVTEEKTFEQAAEEFLKEHKPSSVKFDTGGKVGGGGSGQTANEQMNSILRGAFK